MVTVVKTSDLTSDEPVRFKTEQKLSSRRGASDASEFNPSEHAAREKSSRRNGRTRERESRKAVAGVSGILFGGQEKERHFVTSFQGFALSSL
jgi:hypothetical protein